MFTTRFLALAATFAITGSAFAAFPRDWRERIDTANSALAEFGIEVWADPPDPDIDPPQPDRVELSLRQKAGTVYDFVVVAGDPPTEKDGDPPTEKDVDPPDPDADPPDPDADPPDPDADPPSEHPVTVTVLGADGRVLSAYALEGGKLVEIAVR